MASRMERYYKDELVSEGRSSRNKDLYKQIEDLDAYSNIESVVSIENTNEIEISKVKEMIRDRESYKKQKELNRILNIEKEEPAQEKKQEKKIEEEKNYDINSILTKAKESDPKKEEYHSLGESQYKFLKSLNKKGKDCDLEKEEEELKELINTITSKTSLNNLKEVVENEKKEVVNDEEKINTELDDDDVGLLDDLKSNTMIGDASSIKKLISEEKDLKIDDTGTMDKTFLTTSMGFTQKDFEEFKDINHNIDKSNKFIIILLSVVAVLIVAVILFIILK